MRTARSVPATPPASSRIGKVAGSRGVRAIAVALAVSASLNLLSGTTAHAASGDAVVVPEHPLPVGLTLLGASERGAVVRQDGVRTLFGAHPRVFSGALGTQLEQRPVMVPEYPLHQAQVLAFDGDTVAWYHSAARGACNCDWYAVHRMNVRSGADESDGLVPPPGAYSRGSWYSDRVGSYATLPSAPTLKRFRGPAQPNGQIAGTVVASSPSWTLRSANDGHTMLAAYMAYPETANEGLHHLDLVDLGTGARAPVVSGSPDVISHVAISGDTIAWVATPPGQAAQILRRARSGGPITSHPEPAGVAEDSRLVTTTGYVGYLPAGDSPTLKILSGTAVRAVPLPVGSRGLAAAAGRFYTAAGGDPSTAGVYAVDAAAAGTAQEPAVPVRVATVPPAGPQLTSLTFSASRLRYADTSGSDQPGRPLWVRIVSGSNRPQLSEESLMRLPTEDGRATYAGPAVSFSAGRGAVSASEGPGVRLFDRDRLTGMVPASQGVSVNVSGPYTLIGGDVFRPDGERAHTLDEGAGIGGAPVEADIYGSTVVHAHPDEPARQWKITVEDVEQPETRSLAVFPMKGDDDTACPSPLVSIWGSVVAWTSCDRRSLTVHDLVTGAARVVPAEALGDDGVVVSRMTLGEGVLAWTTSDVGAPLNGNGVVVLDLTEPDSRAVRIPESVSAFVLDDHRIAIETYVRFGAVNPVVIRQLPVADSKYRPRLIAPYALPAFTPDGDGTGDVWMPQFDITKPVRAVELRIADLAGRTVRTIEGTGPDGSVRDLLWDGRDRKGRVAPIGLYRWILTARAEDGDGTLIGPRGEKTVQGAIEIESVPEEPE